MSRYSGGDGALYPAGLLIAALGAAGLVVAAASPGLIARLLSWAPLRWRRAVIRHLPMALAGHRDRSRDHRAATRGPLAVGRRDRHRDHIGGCHLEVDRRANPAERPPGHRRARYRVATESLTANTGTRPCLLRRRAGRSAHGRLRRRVRSAARADVGGPGAADHPGERRSAHTPGRTTFTPAAARAFAETPPPTPASTSGGGVPRRPDEDTRFEGHRHRGLRRCARGRPAASGCPQRDLHKCGDQPADQRRPGRRARARRHWPAPIPSSSWGSAPTGPSPRARSANCSP